MPKHVAYLTNSSEETNVETFYVYSHNCNCCAHILIGYLYTYLFYLCSEYLDFGILNIVELLRKSCPINYVCVYETYLHIRLEHNFSVTTK